MLSNTRNAYTLLVTPRIVHLVSLTGAFVFLLWVNRHQWFDLDEWAFLVGRGLTGGRENLLEPHNEHWSTIPILVYRGLFSVFGTRTYLPYVLVLLTIHLATVHLLWRVMLRSRVRPWTATFLCMPAAVIGVGWENLLSAFQITFVTPVALGLFSLLLLPRRGTLGRRDALVVLLLVVGLAFSGVAVTMVIVVTVYAFMLRGFRVAAEIAAVPALVYFAWFAVWGHDSATPSEPLRVAVQRMPEMVWRGLDAAVDGFTGLAGTAAVLLLLISWFVVTRLLPSGSAAALPVAMALGAPAFLALAALRRSVFGIDAASGSRYSYLVVLFLLPAAGLGIDALLRGHGRPIRAAVIVAVTALLLLVQLPRLNDNARAWAAQEQEQKHRVMATAALIRDGESFLEAVPVPVYMPDLTVADIARLDREDELPGNVEVTAADLLTARASLQVSVTGEPMLGRAGLRPLIGGVEGASVAPTPDGSGCVDVTPRSPVPVVTLDWRAPASIRLLSATGGTLRVGLRHDAAEGRERSTSIAGGEPTWLNVGTKDMLVDLYIPGGLTTLCDVAPLAEEFLRSSAAPSVALQPQ